jgi:uncharacterized protein (DUF58 family)
VIGAGAGLLLIAAGAVFGAPGLVAVGTVVELVWLLRSLWTRLGLRRLSYERRLSAVRAAVGDAIELELVVRNRKLLPLPWLQVEDHVSAEANVEGRQLEAAEIPGFAVLRTTWTLGWFERVTRRLRIDADRRGIYEFRMARLRVADLFVRNSTAEERPMPLRYRVVPRSVPVRAASPISQLLGASRAPRGPFEDPALFAGVRPYQPGDPLRRIHWKATARLRRPVSRRYDPAHERELIVALDAQTLPGHFWVMHYDDDLAEGLCMVALSLARSLISAGVACGFAANAYSTGPGRMVYLAPSASSAQVARIADELAGLSRWASQPFANVLAEVGRRTPPATSVLALSARAPDDILPVLRRLRAMGRQARFAALGDAAAEMVARVRAAGVPADIVRIEPDWRTADAIELAG